MQGERGGEGVVEWVMQGWGRSCSVRVGYAVVRWAGVGCSRGGSRWDGAGHPGVGWVM